MSFAREIRWRNTSPPRHARPKKPFRPFPVALGGLTRRHKAAALAVGAAIVVVAATAVFAAGSGVLSADSAGHGAKAAPTTRASGVPVRLTTGLTLLAELHAPEARYSRPGTRASGVVPASWYGRQSVLPVIAIRPGWVRVRLAQRPDGSTTWLRDADVSFGSTPYKILINLADTHLSLYKQGRLVFTAPAGVGTTDDPTPTGQYFVAFVEPPPSPAYGAFVLVTSDHSEAIQNWEGSGDAVIGIHGPLGEDAEIGTTGARISHGCIRLHERDLLKLRGVPAGTPIEIID